MIGHNPKTQNQHDELNAVTALLQDLPRVTVPADFNSSLKKRIALAQAEAQEFADVTALLRDLPRVTATPDFDFKLKARIAQAKSAQAEAQGWLAAIFGRSFSVLQAGAALAMVAVIAAGVSFKFMHSAPVNSASNNAVVASNRSVPVDTSSPSSNLKEDAISPAPVSSGSVSKAVSARTIIPVKANYSKPERINNIVAPSVSIPSPAPENTIADVGLVMVKHSRNGAARMIKLVSYGQQTAINHQAVANASTDEIATQIY